MTAQEHSDDRAGKTTNSSADEKWHDGAGTASFLSTIAVETAHRVPFTGHTAPVGATP